MLTRKVPDYQHLRTLFLGSGEFHKEGRNTSKQFDCLIVDEAHRLTQKTKKSFMYYGENQIQEIIHASRVTVFFLDETQQIDIKDFGTRENILAAAEAEDAIVLEQPRFELHSQFRCNGSDEYVSWVESILYNKKFISDGEPLKYTVEIVDNAGYLPIHSDFRLAEVFANNAKEICKDVDVIMPTHIEGISTDLGDVATMIPSIMAGIGGFVDGFHTKNFKIANEEEAYIVPAKILACTVIDLLANQGAKVQEIKSQFTSVYSMNDYEEIWKDILEFKDKGIA
jgi:hypothetical protein